MCFIAGLFFLLCVSCCRHSMGLTFVLDVIDREGQLPAALQLRVHMRNIIRFQSCGISYFWPLQYECKLFVFVFAIYKPIYGPSNPSANFLCFCPL